MNSRCENPGTFLREICYRAVVWGNREGVLQLDPHVFAECYGAQAAFEVTRQSRLGGRPPANCGEGGLD